jgi:hypothetical protein
VTSGYERSSLGPGWYPDALLPQRHGHLHSGFPFSVPDLYNNIPDQKNQALWIDLFIPYDREVAPPGRYTGDLGVSWKGVVTVFMLRLTSGTSHCRKKTTFLATYGMARCAKCRPMKNLPIIN